MYISMDQVHGALSETPLRWHAALQACSSNQQAGRAESQPELSPSHTQRGRGAGRARSPLSPLSKRRGIRGGRPQAGAMKSAAAAALRPHKAPPARVPTRCVAALCAACFLLGLCVVNRCVRLRRSPPPNPASFLMESPRSPLQ